MSMSMAAWVARLVTLAGAPVFVLVAVRVFHPVGVIITAALLVVISWRWHLWGGLLVTSATAFLLTHALLTYLLLGEHPMYDIQFWPLYQTAIVMTTPFLAGGVLNLTVGWMRRKNRKH